MTTVCRALADEANKDAAPMDKVTPRALVERVRTKDGKDLISSDRGNEQEPEQTEKEEEPEMQPAALPTLRKSLLIKLSLVIPTNGDNSPVLKYLLTIFAG